MGHSAYKRVSKYGDRALSMIAKKKGEKFNHVDGSLCLCNQTIILMDAARAGK